MGPLRPLLLLAASILCVLPAKSIDLIDPISGSGLFNEMTPNTIDTTSSSSQTTLSTATSTSTSTSTRPSRTRFPTSTNQIIIGHNLPKDYVNDPKLNTNIMIGGLMILIVGLIGPLVLYFWIRKRRRMEEAEWAAVMVQNQAQAPPYQPPRRGMEMSVNRPPSPSGVPPPPTYQEALASRRVLEQPK
jgi:hypothetical protein